MIKDLSKIKTWHIWKVTYLHRNVTIVCGATYHLLGSRISQDSKIRFWLQVKSYISDWRFSESRHLAFDFKSNLTLVIGNLANCNIWQDMFPATMPWPMTSSWSGTVTWLTNEKSGIKADTDLFVLVPHATCAGLCAFDCNALMHSNQRSPVSQ